MGTPTKKSYKFYSEPLDSTYKANGNGYSSGTVGLNRKRCTKENMKKLETFRLNRKTAAMKTSCKRKLWALLCCQVYCHGLRLEAVTGLWAATSDDDLTSKYAWSLGS